MKHLITGWVHSFESMGALDGPGLRFVVFFSGCPLRCRYCHNPDTWEMSAGTETPVDEILAQVKRYRPYFKNGGGITLSGGEPLMQPEFALEILKQCRELGISTCVDTAGSIFHDRVKAVLSYTDLVLLDVKHTDAGTYHALTGGDIQHNKAFLSYCKAQRIPLWIRQVILPGWNAEKEDMRALLDYVEGANVKKIELLPYHTLGVHKWNALGLPYPLEGLEPPSSECMEMLRSEISSHRSS